jgi:Rel homology DNA-binding domain
MSELLIIEQPSSTFRYRYKSELHGAHGHIAGETSIRSKKTLPAVVLVNPPETSAIIRCTLSAAEADAQHPHLLVNKTKIGLVSAHHTLIIFDLHLKLIMEVI